MLLRLPIALFWMVPLAGCLQPGPAPSGTHLFHSQNLESPSFVDDTTVRFRERVVPASGEKGTVYNLWLAALDTSDPDNVTFTTRLALASYSDRWSEQSASWSPRDYPAAGDHDIVGERYFMANESTVPSNTGTAQVASLVRLGTAFDEQLRIDGVSTYTRFTVPIAVLNPRATEASECPGFPGLHNNCPQLFFERPAAPGTRYPTLVLWNGSYEMPIGLDSGSFQIHIAGGNSYFILDEGHVLTRFRRPDNALDSLRGNVARFSISGDERYAALAVTDDNKSQTVIRDLQTGEEIPLAKPNPSAWGGFSGNSFYYYMNATSSTQAEIHVLDLTTGDERLALLPKPLTNYGGYMDRPDSNERLLLDSPGHGVFVDKGELTAKRVLQGPLVTSTFTTDGSFLIYVDPALPTAYDTYVKGALMFQRSDTSGEEPPTMISPPGLLVGASSGPSYFFIDGDHGKILVFWAHFGRTSSDLYFADYRPGELPTNLRLVARQIMYVSISEHSLFGILNVSQQDDVGDLVYRDLDHGVDKVIAQAVSDDAERTDASGRSWVAYIVRGRTLSDRSGLWFSRVTPPEIPDGGTN
jgi:hypothetical protein